MRGAALLGVPLDVAAEAWLLVLEGWVTGGEVFDGSEEVGAVGWFVDLGVALDAGLFVGGSLGAGLVELGVVDEFVLGVEEVEVGGAGGVELAGGLL